MPRGRPAKKLYSYDQEILRSEVEAFGRASHRFPRSPVLRKQHARFLAELLFAGTNTLPPASSPGPPQAGPTGKGGSDDADKRERDERGRVHRRARILLRGGTRLSADELKAIGHHLGPEALQRVLGGQPPYTEQEVYTCLKELRETGDAREALRCLPGLDRPTDVSVALKAVIESAMTSGILSITPPLVVTVAERIHEKLRKQFPGPATTAGGRGTSDWLQVAAGGHDRLQAVARRAAQFVLQRVLALGKSRPRDEPVRIGLGGGRTPGLAAYKFARLFARQLDATPRIDFWELGRSQKGLFLHQTPLVYLTPLGEKQKQCRYLHLDQVKEEKKKQRRPDIILTSISDPEDEHDQIRLELGDGIDAKQVMKAHSKEKWIGTVQWRPLSKYGPIKYPKEHLPAVAYEIDELKGLRDGGSRHPADPCDVVLLVSGCPVADCNGDKTAPLLAVLKGGERLRFFSLLIIDEKTGQSVVREWDEHPRSTGRR